MSTTAFKIREALQFRDMEIIPMEYRGQPVVMATQVSQALGYRKRDAINQSIRDPSRWTEFTQGEHYFRVDGEELRVLKSSLGQCLTVRQSRVRSAVLLTEAGLHLVLLNTSMPIGEEIRKFMAEQVMPQLRRTGAYVPPEAQLPQKSQSLTLIPQRQRDVPNSIALDKLESLRGRGVCDDNWIDHACAMVLADELGLPLPSPSHDDVWLSATQIADLFGCTSFEVGVARKDVGLQGNQSGLCRKASAPVRYGPQKSLIRDVPVIQYTHRAVRLIGDRLAESGVVEAGQVTRALRRLM